MIDQQNRELTDRGDSTSMSQSDQDKSSFIPLLLALVMILLLGYAWDAFQASTIPRDYVHEYSIISGLLVSLAMTATCLVVVSPLVQIYWNYILVRYSKFRPIDYKTSVAFVALYFLLRIAR